MEITKQFLTGVILALSITFSSCTTEPSSVSLNFEHHIDGVDLDLYALDYENEFGNKYDIRLGSVALI